MKKQKYDEINDLLVDYIEDDLSSGLKKDLALIVANSHRRKKTLKALEATRDAIEAGEPKAPNLTDDFFNKLHDKVMAQVATKKTSLPGETLARKPFMAELCRGYSGGPSHGIITIFLPETNCKN